MLEENDFKKMIYNNTMFLAAKATFYSAYFEKKKLWF